MPDANDAGGGKCGCCGWPIDSRYHSVGNGVCLRTPQPADDKADAEMFTQAELRSIRNVCRIVVGLGKLQPQVQDQLFGLLSKVDKLLDAKEVVKNV